MSVRCREFTARGQRDCRRDHGATGARVACQGLIDPSESLPISRYLIIFNPLMSTVAMVSAIKHRVPDRAKPSIVIFDIQAL